jgi:beta-lactam-binding protein with PASTA domain/predicted Ser/Thr protein kinase
VTSNERPAIINERYELLKRIGRGGMADVFLGRDRLLDRQVALKVLFPEFAVDPNFVERFRREAQAAANLNHPNIVNVFDWGKHAGTYFIAMEYVDGRTLADILRSTGHLTSKQAAEITSEVAAALGFAHAAGLVHRDIKPANILIGTNGSVKVADFGIARALNSPTEANLTQAGAVMGTATYFSPEQAQGAQPDPRSDLYSLGIVMYEMIAGRPPFSGENAVGIAYRQVHDHPTPLNQLVADVPRPFEAIVAKLLSKDPAVRYSTADALREDIRRFRTGERPFALQAATGPRTTTGQTTAVMPGRRPDPQAQQRTAVQRPAPGQRGGGPRPGDRPPTTGVAVPKRYREQPTRTGWYALAVFFALIALGIGGVLLFNVLSRDDTPSGRDLPDYTGREVPAVIADLEDRGLTWSIATVSAEEDGAFPDNVVHRTEPGPGTVMPAGGLVRLFVNPDTQTAEIPDVAGMTVAQARQVLAEAGFIAITERTEQSDDVPADRVIRTEPGAGEEVSVQDTVTLVVADSGPVGADSTEQGTVEVPYVIESSEATARDRITSVGLEVDVIYADVAPGSQWDGNVMDQSPGQGSAANRGDVVTITVGDAPEPPPQTNPPPTNPPPTNPPQTNPPPTQATTMPTTPPTQPTTTTTQPQPTTTAGPTTTTP